MFDYFDSLAHPTLDGKWTSGRKGISFAEYEQLLIEKTHVIGSVVCGLPGVGSYSAEPFFKACKRLSSTKPIVPVAPIESTADIAQQVSNLIDIGFKGFKLHSRLLNVEYDSHLLDELFSVATHRGLPVFLCTFCYSKGSIQTTTDLYKLIVHALKANPKIQLVLVHGGVHDLMLYYELARQAENVFLDLSYTLLKYHTVYSNQFKFLFSQFDRKLLIGSDSPEYTNDELEVELTRLFDGITTEKVENICSGNILRLLQPI
jgi:predicted TIM-barrel fold metal-dependent hydrolase